MKFIVLAVALAFSTVTSVFAADVPSSVQAVVQRANEEQVQALAKSDLSLMRDTATDQYYQELVQLSRSLAAAGVRSVELVELEFAEATVSGSTARVTTYETWRTVYEDFSTIESRDRNEYTLVQVGGTWKIQADDHPQEQPQNTAPDIPLTRPILPGQSGPGQSANWSGYVAQGQGFSAVSGTWTIPQPNIDGSFASDGAWVGIGGYGSDDLIQAGTATQLTPDGRIRYQAWVELLPAPPDTLPLAVKPGDSVTFTVAETAPTQWTITTKNNTTGQSTSVEKQYESSHVSAEWIEEAPATQRGLLPLSDFDVVNFTGGSVVHNGKTQTLAATGAESITMVDAAGRPIAQPSTLGPDGASFSVTRIDQPATETVQPTPRVRRGRRGGV